ncbi:lariat debranching enzyme, C-terminal domain-containing protein [Phlyctochytrium arcticum]|nr:lariat debranching enzyme, C-terminal domain-containing protein [Phlyctochytrium arcticum]
MHIAVEGCCHGELDKIYASIKNVENRQGIKVDLLLVCGDFQSIRNHADLGALACPEKYRTIGTFYEYYTGAKKAPIPTIFIGGNHEASNYLWELFHGGWVAPNIYFLGFAGVVKFGGLRIGGMSGIYKKHDYDRGYYERQPFSEAHSRSIYHLRKFNVFRMAQITEPMDIMLSHDWPRGIAFHGNTRALLQAKPFLAGEVNTNTLGSYPTEFLLRLIKPRYWFSAHLHVKFAAIFYHDSDASAQRSNGNESKTETKAIENPDEINIASDDEDDKMNVVKTEDEPKTQDAHVTEAEDKSADPEAKDKTADPVVKPEDVTSETPVAAVKEEPEAAKEVVQAPEAKPEAETVEAPAAESAEKPAEVAEKVITSEKAVEDSTASFVVDTEPSKMDEDQPDQEQPEQASEAAQETQAEEKAGEKAAPAKKKEIVRPIPPQVDSGKRAGIPFTKFLALDKCLPNQDFLQILDLPEVNGPLEFTYDEEWLAIVRATYHLFTLSSDQKQVPKDDVIKKQVAEERQWVRTNVSGKPGGLSIPNDFCMTAPPYVAGSKNKKQKKPARPYLNPQTTYFCDLLNLKNVINPDGLAPGTTEEKEKEKTSVKGDAKGEPEADNLQKEGGESSTAAKDATQEATEQPPADKAEDDDVEMALDEEVERFEAEMKMDEDQAAADNAAEDHPVQSTSDAHPKDAPAIEAQAEFVDFSTNPTASDARPTEDAPAAETSTEFADRPNGC